MLEIASRARRARSGAHTVTCAALAAWRNFATIMETKGKLTALDGRKIPVRSKHSAVNFLLQSCGSILVKTSTILLHSRIDWEQWQDKVNMVAHVHDEMQFIVQKDKLEKFKQVAKGMFKKTQEHFNFKTELDGEMKVGQNWSETH